MLNDDNSQDFDRLDAALSWHQCADPELCRDTTEVVGKYFKGGQAQVSSSTKGCHPNFYQARHSL